MQFKGHAGIESAVFQQPEYDFWMRVNRSKTGCWIMRNRKSGCGCSAVAISADQNPKMSLWLQRGYEFGRFWGVQEGGLQNETLVRTPSF